MFNRVIALCSALAIGLLPTIAHAQKESPPNTSTGDPDERICENIVLTGSRLATKRFCGTRAEWADRKRQDREALEGAQKSPCVLTHTGSNGRAAC